MKLRVAVIAILCVGLCCCLMSAGNQVYAQAKKAAPAKITVLNPMGTPPPIQAKAMAARLDTLDGKTIYFVNTGYIGTDRLMAEMMDWFKKNYPKTNLVLRSGSMTSITPALQTEIAEKADAAIVGLGH
ncbi:MAG: hypothetical protein ABSC60_14130 [Acidobacteriota bacterium]